MEVSLQEPENKTTKKDSTKKRKILGSKSSEYYLLNIVAYLLNNKNNFKEKIKPNDLELDLFTDSRMSLIDKLIYKLKLNNISFNPKRDAINNIKIYKEFPPEIEIKDEYYSNNISFKKVTIDLIPSIHKNMYLDISSFPFYIYDTEKKSLEKYLQFKNNNKFILCLYFPKINELKKVDISKIVDGLKYIDDIFDYIENIYIIIQINTKDDAMKIIKNNKLNNLILETDNDKIKYIFNNASNYSINTDENNTFYNIFNDEEEYFFILDQNNKIILLKKDFQNLIVNISIFILKLKKLMIIQKKSYIEISSEKEVKRNDKNKIFIDLLNYILKLKNLNYIFDLEFQFSFSASINEEYTKVNIKKINSISLRGQFRTKEYQYLNNLLITIKNKNIDYNIKEIITIDIDIDFNDMKCFNCSKNIPDEQHLYYCYICKAKYCYKCVHEQLKKNGIEKYIDKKHNLIFFKTRNKNNFMTIDKSKLGNNRFSETTNNNLRDSHSAICNGCRGHFEQMARYVCLTCRPGLYLSGGYIDYCQKCIELMCSDENKKNELENNANEETACESNCFTSGHVLQNRHKHNEHIYLLLPLEVRSESSPYKNY